MNKEINKALDAHYKKRDEFDRDFMERLPQLTQEQIEEIIIDRERLRVISAHLEALLIS